MILDLKKKHFTILETFFCDPCSNLPSYEGSRLTMAKITNRDNICRLNSVAELEIISLLTNSNCMENQCSTGENHAYYQFKDLYRDAKEELP